MLLQASSQLIATDIRDYPEWHRGRSDYGVWYIEICQPKLIHYLNEIRAQFSDLLIQSNQRQYHITLFVCGFLTSHHPNFDDDFEIKTLSDQIKLIQQLQLEPFELEITQINSFSSALFLHIDDQKNILSKIRKQLAQSSTEIAAVDYCSHITLGLYRENWPSDLVLQRIQKLPLKKMKVQINQLIFGYYKAQILQGLLYPYHQVELG